MVEISAYWLFFNGPQYQTYSAGTYIHIYDDGEVYCWASPSSFTLGSGQTVTVTVRAEDGYGNVDQSTYTFYGEPLPTYTVTLYAGSGGSVSGAGTYDQGTWVTITATPNTGYHFTNWSDGDTNASRSFNIYGNVTLTAYFAINTYTVSASVDPAGTGSVSGAGTYNHGTTATLTATPDAHYKFVKWNDDTTANPKVFTVTQAVTYTAIFAYAYPNLPVKVDGTWTDARPYVKVSGTWVLATRVWVKVDGTWTESILK